MKVLLDTGVLGLLAHPKAEDGTPCVRWMREQVEKGVTFVIPEVCDYELRRELIRIGSVGSLEKLDRLAAALSVEPVDSPIWRRGAEVWAECRKAGKALASDDALDGDVLLIAIAERAASEDKVVVATTNIKHLESFVDARKWTDAW